MCIPLLHISVIMADGVHVSIEVTQLGVTHKIYKIMVVTICNKISNLPYFSLVVIFKAVSSSKIIILLASYIQR